MRCLFFVGGTQGDIQTSIIVSSALIKAGHSIMVVGTSNFKSSMKKHNIPFIPFLFNYDIVRDLLFEILKRVENSNKYNEDEKRKIIHSLTKHKDWIHVPAFINGHWECYSMVQRYNPDIILGLSFIIYPIIAQAINKPYIHIDPCPSVTTPYFISDSIYVLFLRRSEFIVDLDNPNPLFYISNFYDDNTKHSMGGQYANHVIFAKEYNLDPPPIIHTDFNGPTYPSTTIKLIDQTLFKHYNLKPPKLYFIGYPSTILTDNYQPPQSLIDFLKNGDPPICIGFGSADSPLPPLKREDMFLQACIKTQQRIIFITNLDLSSLNLPKTVYTINFVPHAWLYPQCKAIFNASGSGSFHASVHSGIPTCFIPHEADQPCWAGIGTFLKIGPPMCHIQALTYNIALDRIQDLIKNYDQYLSTCQSYSKKMVNPEDSMKLLVEIFEKVGSTPPDWSKINYNQFKTWNDHLNHFPFF